MKIKMESIGSMMGDCTTNYQLKFDEGCTVRDIVEFALSDKGEWGDIEIKTRIKVDVGPDLTVGKTEYIAYLRYSHGKLLSEPLSDDILNKKVLWCYANGGYTCMGYKITV